MAFEVFASFPYHEDGLGSAMDDGRSENDPWEGLIGQIAWTLNPRSRVGLPDSSPHVLEQRQTRGSIA